MLTAAEKEVIQNYYNRLRQHFRNFKNRQSQRIMISQIAAAFAGSTGDNSDKNPVAESTEKPAGNNILVVEAPTGVGKSLAYLLAGTAMAQSRGKKLVVVTATVALQEQLVDKDLPEFIRNSGLDATYALAKGRTHYLSPPRLYEYTSHCRETIFGGNNVMGENSTVDSEEFKLLQEITAKFKSGDFDGDRARWPGEIKDTTWHKINNNRNIYLNKDFAFREEDPFSAARKNLHHTDIIIINYDLLLADLVLGGGVILPAPQDCFYCFDEAHHLAKKAREHFAVSCHLGELKDLENRLINLAKKLQNSKILHQFVPKLTAAVQGFRQLLLNWEYYLTRPENTDFKLTDGQKNAALWLLQQQDFSPDFKKMLVNISLRNTYIKNVLIKLQEGLGGVNKKEILNFDYERLQNDLLGWLELTDRAQKLWQLFLTARKENELPLVKWIKKEQGDFEFHGSPLLASGELNQFLWNKCAAAVLTSATLKTVNGFSLFLRETGLAGYPEVKTLALDSPFNLKEQVELYIPPLTHNPAENHLHTREIADWLPKLINLKDNIGTLCLFSSKIQMTEVFALLTTEFKDRILIQGSLPAPELLQQHRDNINRLGLSSIIFGLDSFAEGLDLKGKLCGQVIIAKIPFPPPNTPVNMVYDDWLRQQGKNAFSALALPAATLKLKQAMGRLIRAENDSGRITILDNRLLGKNYGKIILAGFPSYKRITAL